MKYPANYMVTRKPFILLEVMLAFALLGLCFLPLFLNPATYLKKEMQLLEKMELQRISELSFTQILEQMHTGKVTWNALTQGNKDNPFLYSDRKVRIPWVLMPAEDRAGRAYREKIFLWAKEVRTLENGEKYLRAAVRLIYSGNGETLTFTHKFVVKNNT
jgi:hypothetical protein